MTQPILAITGGTGFVGATLVRHAAMRGHKVRALTRKPQTSPAKIEWVQGALDRPDSLARLVEGADAVIHVAGAINARDRAAFEECNVVGTLNMIEAAKEAGVRRFIHVSSLAAREPDLSDYGWSKARSEQVVGLSGLDWTIVRPPAVFGPGDTEMLDLFRMARRGIALVPSGRMSAIYVDELARLLVTLAADHGASIRQIYEPDDGRPTGWSHRSFARAVARAVGRQRLSTVATPALLLKAGGRLDKLVRRSRAKLTPDRARYIAHPDWVATEGACPPAALWRPERDTDDALAETVRWYRREGWL